MPAYHEHPNAQRFRPTRFSNAGVEDVYQGHCAPHQAGGWNYYVRSLTSFFLFLSCGFCRSIAVRRVAFAENGDRADLYIRTSLKRSPSGVMAFRRPMLIMRVEKVHWRDDHGRRNRHHDRAVLT
jgi:hypothetical protein